MSTLCESGRPLAISVPVYTLLNVRRAEIAALLITHTIRTVIIDTSLSTVRLTDD